jgi:hypothetical protein
MTSGPLPVSVPSPPLDTVMPQTAQILFLALSAALVLAGLAYGVHRWRTQREGLLFLLLAGGAVASTMEPIVGILGHMYIPREGAWIAFTFIERSEPIFVPLAYAGYVGGFAYIAYRVAREGTNPKRLWYLYAIGVVAIAAFETPAVLMDVYYYYGEQPLNFWGLPLWWTFVNPLSGMFVGVLIHVLRRAEPTSGLALSGWLAIPIMCVGPGIANGATAIPMWLVLGDDTLGAGWQYLAAAATLGLALMWVKVLTVMSDSPSPVPAEQPPGQGTSSTARQSR